MKPMICMLCIAAVALSLNGCVLAAAGVGAAAGYGAHKEGYRLQAPVKKEEQW